MNADDIEHAVTGTKLGQTGGTIYCDSCVRSWDIHEQGETTGFTGHAHTPTSQDRPYRLRTLYCPECDDRTIGTPTVTIDEAMVALTIDYHGNERMAEVVDAEIIDRSRRGHGDV